MKTHPILFRMGSEILGGDTIYMFDEIINCLGCVYVSYDIAKGLKPTGFSGGIQTPLRKR